MMTQPVSHATAPAELCAGVVLADATLLQALDATRGLDAPFDLANSLSIEPDLYGLSPGGELVGTWAIFEGIAGIAGCTHTLPIRLAGIIVAQEFGRVVVNGVLVDPSGEREPGSVYLGWVEESAIDTFNPTHFETKQECRH